MRDTITRQFVKNACVCAVYNGKDIIDEAVVIPYGFNDEKSAEKYIRKNNSVNGKLVYVKSVNKIAALYGMSESDFVSKAKLVDARSKETRGFVSKTVKGFKGNLVYMHKATYQTGKKEVFFSENKKLDKLAKDMADNGTIGITIEDVEEVERLYVMPEADFISCARPMIDHQHYAK